MIGNQGNESGKLDTVETDLDTLKAFEQASTKIYPTTPSGDGVVLTGAGIGPGWGLGSIVEVVPASTISNPFRITGIYVDDSDDSVYEIILYSGAGDTEIGRARFSKVNAGDPAARFLPVVTPEIAADSRIRAKVSAASDTGKTVTIALQYQELI